MGWMPALAASEVDGPTKARVGTQEVVLIRVGYRFFATEPLCPHKFGPLDEGHIEGGCLVCPLHDAHFDPSTGRPRKGDEWAGELRTFACRVRQGQVEVELPAAKE